MITTDCVETGAEAYRAVHASFRVRQIAMPASKEKWSRSKSVPFPKIWRKCSGLKKMDNGEVPNFTIQDIPEDRHEEIVDFMTTHFCRDETTCMSVGFLEDPDSVLEMQKVWRDALKQNMALVAFLENEEDEHRPRIAGCNITCVTTKDEKTTYEEFNGRCLRTIMKYVLGKPTEMANVFERYGVNEYMTALGLCVDPVFRGQGLGLEILKARFDLCKAVDVKVTMTVFSGIASQTLAYRVGMEVIAEVWYEECKEDGKPAFPNIQCKSVKAMAKRFNGVAMKRMVTDGMGYISNYVNIFEKYGVTEFLAAFGLYVHPDFRGQGLGTEILRTRTNLGKALGLKVTKTFFTTKQGQMAAQKAGMEVLADIPYTIFKTEDGKEVYTNMNTKTLKIMAMRLD